MFTNLKKHQTKLNNIWFSFYWKFWVYFIFLKKLILKDILTIKGI